MAKRPSSTPALAAESTGPKKHRGGPGRPFKKGEPPPCGRPFPPGISANPGGLPKTVKELRAKALELAQPLMEHAALRLGIPQELGGLTAPELAFLQAVWDRGGFKVAPDAPAAGGLGAPKRVVVEYEQPPAPAEPPKPEPTGDE